MDFISIIIPAYNAERWLDRCLRSVMQAIDVDCEVIIVNDDSTDNTQRIAREYADKDSRFSVVNIPHTGPCATRNAGFLESQGDYIMFVDSDDTLPANAIRDQRRLLNLTHDADDNELTSRPMIVICNTVVRTHKGDTLLLSGKRRRITGMEYGRQILSGELPGFLPGHVYSRSLLEAIEWDDHYSITHHDHQYLTLSLAMKINELDPEGKNVLIDASMLCYNYLRRPGSQSALMSLTPEGLERVWAHLSMLGLPEPEFTYWGLDLIYKSFIERGVPFNSNFKMAVDLRERARRLGDKLPVKYKEVIEALDSSAKRAKLARRLSRSGGLTSIAPHLSFIMVCNHNIGKVQRSLESIFHTGLRNLDVILVDLDNTHDSSVALTNLCTSYPRVRIVKVPNGIGVYKAAVKGLDAVGGLCVMFVRPGDLVSSEGIYNAVTHIDYGADVVLVNHRHFNPLTRLRSSVFSYSYLRATEEASHKTTAVDMAEDIYDATVNALKAITSKSEQFNIYGVIWRRCALIDTGLNSVDFDDLDRSTISHRAMRNLLNRRLRVIAQDEKTPVAYEFATDSLFKHAVSGRLAFFLF